MGKCSAILGFSGYEDEAHVMGMINSGAAGYILKTEEPGQVLEAVRKVAEVNLGLVSGLWKVCSLGHGRRIKIRYFGQREMDILQLIGGCDKYELQIVCLSRRKQL
jgi:DNA-binding NarL/FixJ family response regulator